MRVLRVRVFPIIVCLSLLIYFKKREATVIFQISVHWHIVTLHIHKFIKYATFTSDDSYQWFFYAHTEVKLCISESFCGVLVWWTECDVLWNKTYRIFSFFFLMVIPIFHPYLKRMIKLKKYSFLKLSLIFLWLTT